jgi:hypothetical protein
MADQVQLRFGADIGSAISALNTLKAAVAAAAEPVAQLRSSFAAADAALQQTSARALAAFKAQMQEMVAARALSQRQALGYDVEYSAQQYAAERARFENILANDAATVTEKSQAYARLLQLSAAYTAELARDQSRIAEAARKEADKLALPYRQAFDAIGAGWRSAVIGLVEGTETFRTAALGVVRAVERGVIGMIEATLSKMAAAPLAALLGIAAPGVGEGVGDVLGRAAGQWLFGAPASAAAPASGGLLGFLGSLFAFKGGGIVPSAAGGWSLPNFPGATPALLHAREMVLPAPISEGLQNLIATGGPGGFGGGDMHLHFHGPSDGAAVERWFTGLMARNPGVVRNMLRGNALTPRTL